MERTGETFLDEHPAAKTATSAITDRIQAQKRRRAFVGPAVAPLDLARGGDLGEVLADAPQVAREVPRRAVALLRVLREAPLDDPAEGRRHAARRRSDRLGIFTDDRGERFGAVSRWKARFPVTIS